MSVLSRSISKSLGTTVIRQAVTLGLVVIVSRLLSPSEIGAYVLAFGIMTFLEPMRELQVRAYVLVADEVTPEYLAPVRMLAFATTALVGVLSLLIAGLLWALFEDPAAGNCMAILALATVFRPFSQPAEAVLQKRMRYGAIAGMRLGGIVLGAIASLGLIFSGFGIESLAWGIVLQYACETSAIAMVQRELRFGPISSEGIGEVWKFCARFSGVQLLTRSIANIEPMLVGFFLGLSATAFYNRGNRLIRTVRTGVEEALLPIALSEFSRLKAQRELIGDAFLRAISRMTGVLWPVFAALALMAEPAVLFLFGDQWGPSVPIAKILSIGGMVYVLTALSQQAHASIGETALLLKRESWISLIRVVILLVAVQFTIEAVAVGILLLLAISCSVNVYMLQRSFGLRLDAIISAVAPSFGVAVLVFSILAAADHFLFAGLPHWQKLGLAGLIAMPTWSAGIVVMRHPLTADFLAIFRAKSAEK